MGGTLGESSAPSLARPGHRGHRTGRPVGLARPMPHDRPPRAPSSRRAAHLLRRRRPPSA